METWELEAREAIRDTLAAYHHHGDRLQITELAALFTLDGVLEVRGRAPAVGREAIIAFLAPDRLPRGTPAAPGAPRWYVRHHLATVWIERIGPTDAEVRAYFSVISPIGLDHWGRYHDRLVLDGDRWRFTHRHVGVDGYAPESAFAPLTEAD